MRYCLLILSVVPFLLPQSVEAQHCRGFFGSYGSLQPLVVTPGLGYSGYVGPAYGRTFLYQVGNPDLYYTPGLYSPQLSQPTPAVAPGNILSVQQPKTSPQEPSKVPVVPSSPAARLKSLDHQARGDQRLRAQKWSEARAAYRSAVDVAPDRAEAHLRLGLCLVAIQRFDSAIHEFKRAIFIDPLLPQAGKISKVIFGPDSKAVRASIISKLTDWVKDDYANSDRLFLMGVMLHFEGDPRSQEFFEAARRMKRGGDDSHIAGFIPTKPVDAEPEEDPLQVPAEVPPLNNKPVPVLGLSGPKKAHNGNVNFLQKGAQPVPGAPVPMPDL